MHRCFRLLLLSVFICMGNFSCLASDTLQVHYYPSPPFVIEEDDGTLSGISVWLWEHIANDLDRPVQMNRTTLKQVIKDLASGDADVCINSLTITSERSRQFDFSAPFFVSNSSVAALEVSSLQKAWQFISSFFSTGFLKAVVALFAVIFIFGLLGWIFERKKNPEEFYPGVKGLWSGIWWSAVTMTTVGYGDKSPRSTGGRIVALVWMFTAIIIISGFTAGIASSLTVNQLGWNQNQAGDFKDRPVATIGGSATNQWLKDHFFKDVQSCASLEECLQWLTDGSIEAVMYDEPRLQFVVNGATLYQPAVQILPIRFNLQLYAMAFCETLPSDIKETISNRILEITESADWEVVLSEYDLSKM